MDMQTAVGGHIEILCFGDRVLPRACPLLMVLNGDGKLLSLTENESASRFAHIYRRIMCEDYIAGPVLFGSYNKDETTYRLEGEENLNAVLSAMGGKGWHKRTMLGGEV